MLGCVFEKNLILWVVGQNSAPTPSARAKTKISENFGVRVTLRESKITICIRGHPFNDTFTNSEDQDKRLDNAVLH